MEVGDPFVDHSSSQPPMPRDQVTAPLGDEELSRIEPRGLGGSGVGVPLLKRYVRRSLKDFLSLHEDLVASELFS